MNILGCSGSLVGTAQLVLSFCARHSRVCFVYGFTADWRTAADSAVPLWPAGGVSP